MGSERRQYRWVLNGLGVAAALGLASCGGDDHCDHCFNDGAPSTASEISLGLVVDNFTGSGLASVIDTSVIDNGRQPNPGQLNIYLSSAPGTYLTPTSIATGNYPSYLVSDDLNGDRLPDVVAANAQDGTLSVFFNTAGVPGTFAAPLTLDSPGASQLAIADMNGDGLPDLVSADYNVSLFEQTSPGVFANPISLSSGGANWVAVGDLNGDGIADVAITDNAGVSLIFHTGAAGVNTYGAPALIYAESSNVAAVGANIVAIADVNGDGLNDLIITDPGPQGGKQPFVSVLLQNPLSPGTFLAPVAYSTPADSQAYSIQVSDLDGDTLPEIVIGGSRSISVLFNQPTAPGTFFAADNYSATNANQIAIADVNGDGLPDIVTTTGVSHPLSNGVYLNNPGVLLQNPSDIGFFTALQDLP